MNQIEKKKKLKTFEDLKFITRIDFFGGIRAEMSFENGYGVSVIQGGGAYTSGKSEYELAVLKGKHLCYSTPITDDVLGHQTKKDVSKIMAKVQRLPQ